jgi:hypothetical protein
MDHLIITCHILQGGFCTLKWVKKFIFSRVRVTIDGVWSGNSIYWPFIHSQLVTTNNYSAITNLHILKISRSHAKSFQSVFTSLRLVTASNSGDSSASRGHAIAGWPPPHNWTELSQSQSQIYFTTGGLPPISSSWCQAPWDLRPEFFSTELLR